MRLKIAVYVNSNNVIFLSVWFGVAPGNRGHQTTNDCNTEWIKLHGNNWETKWDLSDLSDHTPAAKGNVGLMHMDSVAFILVFFFLFGVI